MRKQIIRIVRGKRQVKRRKKNGLKIYKLHPGNETNETKQFNSRERRRVASEFVAREMKKVQNCPKKRVKPGKNYRLNVQNRINKPKNTRTNKGDDELNKHHEGRIHEITRICTNKRDKRLKLPLDLVRGILSWYFASNTVLHDGTWGGSSCAWGAESGILVGPSIEMTMNWDGPRYLLYSLG